TIKVNTSLSRLYVTLMVASTYVSIVVSVIGRPILKKRERGKMKSDYTLSFFISPSFLIMSVLPRDIYDLIIGFSGGYKEWKKTHPPLPYLNDIHRVNTDRSYLLDVYKVCISMNDLILLLPHKNS